MRIASTRTHVNIPVIELGFLGHARQRRLQTRQMKELAAAVAVRQEMLVGAAAARGAPVNIISSRLVYRHW